MNQVTIKRIGDKRPATLRLSLLVRFYLETNQYRIEESTVKITERVSRYLINFCGDIKIQNFGYIQAEDFQNWILDGGRNEVTANIYIKTIRPVFRWAIRMNWLEKDPFEDLLLFKISKKRIRIFEPTEFTAMLDSCSSKLWQARLLLAKTAGLRKGEVLNLTVENIDFDKGLLYIQPKKETHYTWRWLPKDKDLRELPLVPQVGKLLIELLISLPDKQPYLLLTAKRYRYLLQLKEEGALSERNRKRPDENWTKPWRQILKRAEIKSGTFHDLRRTCITEWLENGLQPHEVMKLAGHSSIETTLKYYVATRRNLVDKARLASIANLKRQDGEMINCAELKNE